MYLKCVVSIFVAMGLSLVLMILGWIRNKKFKPGECVMWLLWFSLVMAIVTC